MENKNEPIVLKKPVFITMKDLNPGTRVTMHLKVESVTVTRERMRYEGNMSRQANCIVGDEHGCVNLVARDEQLDLVKPGALITIRNAHANVVDEHLRIEIDKWAKIELSAKDVPKIGVVNSQNNLSTIEYELVPVKN
mmetsp:Transcript_8485/g.14268  ORF Transcript_8485/g.14268 Transcript_8485/m.14268 type:complete len:138 (-) Transcript_8485:99-512(-)